MDRPVPVEPVAVVGLGVVSAAGDGSAALLHAVRTNRIALSECERFADGPYMTNRVGTVPADAWEAVVQAQPNRAHARVYRLASRAATEAMQQAQAPLASADPDRVGLVLSTTKADIEELTSCVRRENAPSIPGGHILSARLASDLAVEQGACGPIQCVSVACISGLLAVQQGARMILSGAADVVLVVGVDVLSHFVVAGFSTLRSLDPLGSRPFDKARQGLSLGEGAGAIVLCRSDRAATPLARIRGWGVSNDANHLTGPSRDGSGLALAIQRALRLSGVEPGAMDAINAHGTGTVYNDRMEALALQTVFGDGMPPVSSCKGMIGHTLGAAGVIECALCILATRAHVMPGTPGFTDADPDAPAHILREARHDTAYRWVLKTNSGFGGTNSALVLDMGGCDE